MLRSNRLISANCLNQPIVVATTGNKAASGERRHSANEGRSSRCEQTSLCHVVVESR